MKTVVIYKSISGFTKKYAEWIAQELRDKSIIIFTTGASPSEESTISDVRDSNFSAVEQKEIQFYYFRGGFDFNKLNPINKILMTLFKWKMKLKQDKTSDEKGMLAAYLKPVDFTKKENIKELLEYVRSLKCRIMGAFI